MIYKSVKVTFYDAKVCAPLKSGKYLCFLDTYYMSLEWSAEFHGWNVHTDGSRENEIFPTAWAEQPEMEATTE